MNRVQAIPPIALIFGAVTAVAGCGEQSSNASTPPPASAVAATETAQPAARKGVSIKVQGSRFGKMLFSGGGQAIYLFTKENGSKAKCYGACAKAWPPVLTRGKPRARSGVDESKLGTTKSRDGKTQVTYSGHPLYYYEHDPVNKVLCQDVFEFGGKWYVVSPNGSAIT